jgi:hypothetical protein
MIAQRFIAGKRGMTTKSVERMTEKALMRGAFIFSRPLTDWLNYFLRKSGSPASIYLQELSCYLV